MVDALRQFGLTTTRGIAVVNTNVSDSTPQELQAAGVCGIRFNLLQAGATTAYLSAVVKLLQSGKCWMKLSGAYMDTRVGAPSYADRGEVAKAYIQEAPERLVWGTDWPHPTTNDKPDDALLFDLLAQWCPDEAVRTRILVRIRRPIRIFIVDESPTGLTWRMTPIKKGQLRRLLW